MGDVGVVGRKEAPVEFAANLYSYWGKADPEATGVHDHHSVIGHSFDVAACAYVLLQENSLWLARMADRVGGARASFANTIAAVICLHDVGKFDTRFQLKAPAIAGRLRPATAGMISDAYDHGTEGFRLLDEGDTAWLETLLGVNARALLRAVCGHHGTLPSNDEPAPSRSVVPRALRREDDAARRAFVQATTSWFRARGAALPLPFRVDAPLLQQLAGLCTVADWLGSNTEHFPYRPDPTHLDGYWQESTERARAACSSAGLLRVAPTHTGFSDLFPSLVPRDVQTLTAGIEADSPTLAIVEAVMGSGKTEAALALAAKWLGAGLGEGLTIGLPTMATSNAMLARVEAFTGRLYEGREVQLALAHGQAGRQPRFQALVQRGLAARDRDAAEASVACARWLTGRKRVLLAQVGVGTIDQALQAAIVVRHQFVRMVSLARNVVVLDEVHAYDAYMEVLLEHLVAWLGALDVSVIILSATLPAERRTALIGAWRGTEQPGELPTAPTACALPYPLVTVATRSEHRQLALPDGTAQPTRVVHLDTRTHAPDDSEAIEATAAELARAANDGARVVWIRNTVREAQRAYRALRRHARSGDAALFHARYRTSDRAVREREVIADFGKSSASGGRVLVATQVVEQSLDLDFDRMHTDLAPIDLLLQRAGRLHRHERARPAGFEAPTLVVHAPPVKETDALRFGPSRYVYDPCTLWLAADELRQRSSLTLPGEIRALVERSYHPALRGPRLQLGGDRLVETELARVSELEARRTKARRCCIPPTSADLDGAAALPDDDDTVAAFTRDGTSTSIALIAWDGARCGPLDGGPPWHLDATRTDAWRISEALLDATVSLANATAEGDVSHADRGAWLRWKTQFSEFCRASGHHRLVPLPLSRDGDGWRGWLSLGGRRRRCAYSTELGLYLPTAEEEEHHG